MKTRKNFPLCIEALARASARAAKYAASLRGTAAKAWAHHCDGTMNVMCSLGDPSGMWPWMPEHDGITNERAHRIWLRIARFYEAESARKAANES